MLPLFCKNLSTSVTMPDNRTHYKAVRIKTAWCWHKNKHVNQWNEIETPEVNLFFYNQIIFDKRAKINPWRKQNLQGVDLPTT